ncbi:hypothetical protein DFH09DRAFT_929981, partial [Mycena vulgaris]
NMEALKKHCARSGHRLYVCRAEDTHGWDQLPLTLRQCVVVAGMKMKQTGKLKEHVEIVLGMRAMVMLNISTEGDFANGTREEIVDMKLDAREELPLKEDEATGTLLLKYPPTMLYFKPDKSLFPRFDAGRSAPNRTLEHSDQIPKSTLPYEAVSWLFPAGMTAL